MKSDNYVVIQGWMRNELNLKGNDLLVYAVIYGFSQNEGNEFTGSLQYLADWCGATKQGIQKNLKNLLELGLIRKRDYERNGVKFCAYSCIVCNTVVQGIQHSCTNNIDNKQDNKLFKSKDLNNSQKTNFLKLYNSTGLPKVRKLTPKREKGILNILTKFSQEEINQVFENIKNSDFLNGKNSRGWKADLDFLLREDKFISILEGKYNNKNRKHNNFGELATMESGSYTAEELQELESINAEREANGQRTYF